MRVVSMPRQKILTNVKHGTLHSTGTAQRYYQCKRFEDKMNIFGVGTAL